MITPSYGLTATERVLPKLALDFTTASLDSRVTFTRALNTATRINNNGLIEIVNANLPRFDYTLNTGGSCLGLLVEETRTNSITNSNDITATGWTTTLAGTGAISRFTGYGVSPQVSTSANRLQLSGCSGAGNNALLQTNAFSASAGQPLTLSVYLKTNDATTKTIHLSISGAAVAVVTVTGTWARFTTTWASASAGSWNGRIGLIGGSTSTDADLSFYGAQVEVGSFVTSHIPTTTVGVTRNADVVVMTGTNFSNWWQATIGGVTVSALPSTVLGTRPLVQFDDTTANNIIALRGNTTNPELYVKATTDQAQIDAGTIAANTLYKLSGAWNTNNCAAAINGNAVVTDVSAIIPTATQARLGCDGTNYLNGQLQTIRYWPQRIIDAEVQAFSK